MAWPKQDERAHRERMLARMEEQQRKLAKMLDLYRHGVECSLIAARFGIDVKTVQTYVKAAKQRGEL